MTAACGRVNGGRSDGQNEQSVVRLAGRAGGQRSLFVTVRFLQAAGKMCVRRVKRHFNSSVLSLVYVGSVGLWLGSVG